MWNGLQMHQRVFWSDWQHWLQKFPIGQENKSGNNLIVLYHSCAYACGKLRFGSLNSLIFNTRVQSAISSNHKICLHIMLTQMLQSATVALHWPEWVPNTGSKTFIAEMVLMYWLSSWAHIDNYHKIKTMMTSLVLIRAAALSSSWPLEFLWVFFHFKWSNTTLLTHLL